MSTDKRLIEEMVKPEVSILDSKGQLLMVNSDSNGSTNTISSRNKYVIAGVEIRNKDGLYNLNDVHLASGGANKDAPNYWLANTGTKRFFNICVNFHRSASGILEPTTNYERQASNSAISKHLKIINGGPNRGTYTTELGVIKYASWISEYMELLVISTYLNTTINLSNDLNMAIDTNVRAIDKLAYIQSFSNPGGHTSISEYAVLLSRGSGLDMTPNRLFSVMRKLGYLKTGREKYEKNNPVQKYVSEGYLTGYLVDMGLKRQVFVTLITEKGMAYLSTPIVEKYEEVYNTSS